MVFFNVDSLEFFEINVNGISKILSAWIAQVRKSSPNVIFSTSSEDSTTDDHGNFQESFIKQLQSYITPLLFIGLVLYSFSFGPRDQKQVSLFYFF